ncbi:helix-turn-helix domain-containing protein [Edwardsiella piscicida]|nr:helix-turn-helix domain-containing protein [Edwardsiella piscicida]
MAIEFYGERLRLARLLKGYTLQELGDAVFVTRQSIHQYESDVRAPANDVRNALAEFLQVSTDFLGFLFLVTSSQSNAIFVRDKQHLLVLKSGFRHTVLFLSSSLLSCMNT